MESVALTHLRESQLHLSREDRNREKAIALTYIETAILWLEKDELEANLAIARQEVQRLRANGDTTHP